MNKTIFIGGRDVALNGNRHCRHYISTYRTTETTVKNIYTGMELVFENDRLVKAYEYVEGNKRDRALTEFELGMRYEEVDENRILQVKEDKLGLHQLGGEIPRHFKMPENNCVVPFQYLGYISNEDKNFNWLPFDVHLVCPIFLNFEFVYMDYSDPLHPVIINREEVEEADTSYEDDLNRDTEVVYNPMKFSYEEAIDFSQIGNAGLPSTLQFLALPVCPESGEPMRFLCDFHGGVSANRSNVIPHKESYRHYYEKLNFWGDGDLFVFFQPNTKAACYFIVHS